LEAAGWSGVEERRGGEGEGERRCEAVWGGVRRCEAVRCGEGRRVE
jgi:hypothetical protein